MTMITPSAQLTLTKGNKSWVPGPPSRSTVSISFLVVVVLVVVVW